MKKKTNVTCNKNHRNKIWPATESKDKPGWAICPACGCYHRIKKEQ